MPRRLVAALLLVAVLLGAGWWARDRYSEPTRWVVRAGVRSPDDAIAACGDLPGIVETSFSATSDLPPDLIVEGVSFTVEGRANADDAAQCLAETGASEIKVEERGPTKSFERTGP